LAISVNENGVTAALVHSIYPSDEGPSLNFTNVDGVVLDIEIIWVVGTWVADVNIVIANRCIGTSIITQGDVVAADSKIGGAVEPKQRLGADGRVPSTKVVVRERIVTEQGGFVLKAALVTGRLRPW